MRLPNLAYHILVILILLLCRPAASAQDPQATPPTQSSSGSENSKTEPPDTNLVERMIYVPFRELQKVFNSQDASVVLPWSDYLELVRRSLADHTPVRETQDAVITASRWTAVVEKDIARLTAEIELKVIRENGWVTIPLAFGSAAVGRVEPGDGSVLLRAVAQGQYELLVKAPAPKSVRIELLVPVQTSPEDKAFSIDCPPSGISELLVKIPEPDQTVKISPLQVLLPPDQPAEPGQTHIKASLGAVPRFEVRWAPRDGSKPVMDLLTSVNTRTTARIESGLVQTRTQLNYEILRGELRQLSILAPRDARIIDVTASAGRIRAWNAVAVGETHQLIKVELLAPATDLFQLEVQTERTFQGDSVSLLGQAESGQLYGVHPDAVVRETGQLTLSTDPAITAVVTAQSGMRQISSDAAEKTAAATPESSSTTWEYSGIRSKLEVQLRPVEPRLLVDHQLQYTFRDDELWLNSVLNYQVEKAGVFQLVLQIPPGLNIENVSADGMAEFQVDKGTGKITLALTRKRMGPIQVSLQARQPLNAAVEIPELALPIPTPEGVERESGMIVVFAPEFLEVVTLDERLTGLVPARGQLPEAPSRQRTVGAWTFTRRPISLSIRSAPRPVQLAAFTGTTVQVDPELIRQSSVISWDIRNAGLDTFRIAVPEAVAADVRFRTLSPGHVIRQRDRAATPENGWVTWTLVLQEEATGSMQIAVDWDSPLNGSSPAPEQPAAAPPAAAETPPAQPAPTADTAPNAVQTPAARQVALEPPRILPPFPDEQQARRRVILTDTRGEIRVLRHPSLSIDAVSQSDTAEPIDVRELERLERDGYLAWRYFSEPASATISIRRHELHEVAATVVSRAAVEVVTEPQQLASWRVRFRMTTSERQRLRVDLPAGSDLQAPLIDGRRTTIEKAADTTAGEGREAYYINISREGTSDQDFLLTLLFRCPITEAGSRPYSGLGSVQLLRLPLVGSQDGATVVQQIRFAVWAPDEVALFGTPEGWVQEPRDQTNLSNLIQPPSSATAASKLNDWVGGDGASEFATQGQPAVFRSAGNSSEIRLSWWKWWFLLPVVSGAITLAGLILRRTSWENRFTILLLCCFAAALLSLRQSLGIAELYRTAVPGLLLTALLWMLSLVLGPNRKPLTLVPLTAPAGSSPQTSTAPASTAVAPVEKTAHNDDAQGGAK